MIGGHDFDYVCGTCGTRDLKVSSPAAITGWIVTCGNGHEFTANDPATTVEINIPRAAHRD